MMSDGKVISVIMPIHNITNKRIDNKLSVNSTVHSFFEQNIDNKELIIVDDASSDDSVQYITKFLKKFDSRKETKLISLKEHRGPGGARNVGLKHAKGEYIFFLDADDLIGDNSLSVLVSKADKWDSDFVLGQYVALKRGYAKQFAKNGDIENADIQDNNLTSSVGPWGKLYKKSIIQENNIKFTENVLMFEDMAFVFGYLSYSKKKSISVNDVPHYILRNNDEVADNLTGRKVTLSDRLVGLETILTGIKNSSNILKALALDRLFIYPSQVDPFIEKWNDEEKQEWYFDSYKEILLKSHVHSWLELVPSQSVRVTIQALIENYARDDVVSIGDFSREYFSRWNLFHTSLSFSSILQKILYVGETKRALFLLDQIKFEINSPFIIKFSSDNYLGKRSIVIVNRKNIFNSVEIQFDKSILKIDMRDIILNYKDRLDIYVKYSYNNVLLQVMFPVNNNVIPVGSKFYKNWKGGLTYKYVEE